MGFGFYLTRFVGYLVEINKENPDKFYSLEIYKAGFLKISLISLSFFCLVLCFNFFPKFKKFLQEK
jgi:hypothetical protein